MFICNGNFSFNSTSAFVVVELSTEIDSKLCCSTMKTYPAWGRGNSSLHSRAGETKVSSNKKVPSIERGCYQILKFDDAVVFQFRHVGFKQDF